MKRVLFIIPTLDTGGAEKVLLDIVNNIDPQKYKVEILLIFNFGKLLPLFPEYVRIRYLFDRQYFSQRQQRLFAHFPVLRDWLVCYAAGKVLGGERFDTIVSFMEGMALLVHNYVKRKADRNISWVHCDLLKDHWTKRYFRGDRHEARCFSAMDEVVLVSQAAMDAFVSVFPEVTSAKTVILNPVDVAHIRREAGAGSVEKNRFTILNVGRLVEVKRQDRLLRVVRILNDRGRDVDLWLVGDGSNRMALEKLAEELNVTGHVKFWGCESNPYIFMKSADLFVMSSDSEGYSLVIAESLINGLPVLSTPAIDAGAWGGAVVGTSFDPESIADEVDKFINDPGLREEYSNRSLKKADDFDIETTMNQIYSKL